MSKVRIFIVEDSILMQNVITDILNEEPQFEVVGKAFNGKEALEKIFELKPDLVTLDIHLPDMDGLMVLKEIMIENPTRVVMLSAYTQKGTEITMKALEMGAVDFIPKPSGEISLDLYHFKEDIISKVKIAMTIDINKQLSSFGGVSLVDEALFLKKIVLIGASTGGPKAIMEVMQKMPAYTDATFLIVQHMPTGFTKSFAERISWHSKINTKEAEDKEWILRGAGYVAPAGYHMVIEKVPTSEKECFRIRLDETPLVNFVRPSIDVTMTSAAENFGAKIIAVVLTGMGKDGLVGAQKIKDAGGYIIAQDEATSVVYGMPKEVAAANLADQVLGLSEIPEAIIKRLG